MKKKLFSILTILVILFSVSACGNNKSQDNGTKKGGTDNVEEAISFNCKSIINEVRGQNQFEDYCVVSNTSNKYIIDLPIMTVYTSGGKDTPIGVIDFVGINPDSNSYVRTEATNDWIIEEHDSQKDFDFGSIDGMRTEIFNPKTAPEMVVEQYKDVYNQSIDSVNIKDYAFDEIPADTLAYITADTLGLDVNVENIKLVDGKYGDKQLSGDVSMTNTTDKELTYFYQDDIVAGLDDSGKVETILCLEEIPTNMEGGSIEEERKIVIKPGETVKFTSLLSAMSADLKDDKECASYVNLTNVATYTPES